MQEFSKRLLHQISMNLLHISESKQKKTTRDDKLVEGELTCLYYNLEVNPNIIGQYY